MNQAILLNTTGTSNKFWMYEVGNDHNVTVRWGRMGTAGRIEKKTFDTNLEANNFANLKLQEKFRKGYKEITEEKFELEFIRATVIGSNYRIDCLKLVDYLPVSPFMSDMPDAVAWRSINEVTAANPDYRPIIFCAIFTTGSEAKPYDLIIKEDGIYSIEVNFMVEDKEAEIIISASEPILIGRKSSEILKTLKKRLAPAIATLF